MSKRVYKCTFCENVVERDTLTAMRVQFTTMGKPTKVLKSRVVSWLCPQCIQYEPQWKSDPWLQSPGLTKVEDG
jgi:hypothetical protein